MRERIVVNRQLKSDGSGGGEGPAGAARGTYLREGAAWCSC